jgi:hypothetical protein
LKNDDGWTVAHRMAKNGYMFEDPEIWKLEDNMGWTVAHWMAHKGYIFKNKNMLLNTYKESILNNKNIDTSIIPTKLLKNTKELVKKDKNHKIYKEIEFYSRMNELARKYITLDFNCN